jgi:NAD(P)-dependent dehydrogenase (short-subunit alcohol dehydrogenase family)
MEAKRKRCLITGANAGIGKETARQLAALGWEIVMLCRDAEKGFAARSEIVAATGNPDISVMPCDLASQTSIRRFATEFLQRYDRLDVLLHNAGTVSGKRRETGDGIEYIFAVNHLASFLLTHYLLDTLKASAPSRIVLVASDTHKMARYRQDDLQFRKRYSEFGAYAHSKLLNMLFALELAERLQGSGVTVNTVHPGMVRSEIWEKGSWIARLMPFFMGRRMQTVEEGAATSVFVASEPALEGVSGEYFARCREASPAAQARDSEAARHLWEQSVKLAGI